PSSHLLWRLIFLILLGLFLSPSLVFLFISFKGSLIDIIQHLQSTEHINNFLHDEVDYSAISCSSLAALSSRLGEVLGALLFFFGKSSTFLVFLYKEAKNGETHLNSNL